MGWPSRLKKVLGIAKDLSPIISVFVPGASTITDAIDKIHGDEARPNEDAVKLLAATVEAQERRIIALEKAIKSKK